MKSSLVLFTFILSITTCFGQTDTAFFNSDWIKCDKAEAKYYRTIVKDKNNYIVSDRFLNNNPQMIAICSNATEPLIKNGFCTFYYENGKIESKGVYRKNEPIGTWIWYEIDGKDSTVATYKKDGTKEYTRFSKGDIEKQKTDENIYTMAERMPEFPGGPNALNQYLASEFNVPKLDKDQKTKGTFYVIVIVNEDGRVTFSEIKKSLSPALDEEAKRVINKMPYWMPGKMGDKPVKVRFSIPFKID